MTTTRPKNAKGSVQALAQEAVRALGDHRPTSSYHDWLKANHPEFRTTPNSWGNAVSIAKKRARVAAKQGMPAPAPESNGHHNRIAHAIGGSPEPMSRADKVLRRLEGSSITVSDLLTVREMAQSMGGVSRLCAVLRAYCEVAGLDNPEV